VEAYGINLKASVPTQGDQEANIAISEKSRLRRRRRIPRQGFYRHVGCVAGHTEGTYRVSATGELSELSGGKKDEIVGDFSEEPGASLRAVERPAGRHGAQWSGQRILYAPDTGGPVSMPPLKLNISCKLTGFETAGGKTLAKIDITAVQAPGESTLANLTGTYRLDAAAGRVVSGFISGVLKVKALFTRVDVPIQVTIK